VVIVLDLEPVLKLTTATPVVSENGVSFIVKVERQDQVDLSAPLVVNLSASLGLTVPLTVTIPATKASETFTVNIVDNAKLEGSRTATIQATGNLIAAGNLSITITDHEKLTVTVNKASILENAGPNAAVGTVTRGNTENPDLALVVFLSSSDLTELKVPASVTIPAGQLSATFQIEAVNDPILDGTQTVIITATSAGYIDGTVSINVLDHEPPVLTGPTSATPLSKPTITWTALAGAIRYDVWISNLTTGVSQTVRNIAVPTNSFVPPENLGIGRYRVWVRAIDAQEQSGFWSLGRDFYVNTPAVIRSPASTVANAERSFPTITWSAIPDATKYELWVNNLTTNKSQVIYRVGAAALSTTSFRSATDLGSGIYKAWVRGLNAQGEAGLWSTAVVFTVLAPPAIIQPVGGGTFDRTPTFTWTSIKGATNYDVWVGDATTRAIVIRNQFVQGTSLTALQDMPVGEYRIWVRAQNDSVFSAWSVPTEFSVGLPPEFTSAKTVGTPAKPQFTWTTIAGTETYELWVTNITANVRVIHHTTLTKTTYTSATALPAGTYRAWVRAVGTMGEVTAWSSPITLVIAASGASDGSLDAFRTVVLPSRSIDDGTLTPEDSPTERPEVVVNDSEPENNLVDTAAGIGELLSVDQRMSANNVQPATTVEAECDAIMSDWQSADWWVETPENPEQETLSSATTLAASVGLFVRRSRDSDDRQKRRIN
ncbi:MAG: hypothetical protein O2856_07025, partial [Planctomycetota bacterium]|nr:hypothetical protein [Planctomycetota bacterium]